MPCLHVVCTGPTKRCACGRPATLECDWKVPTRKSGTCDKPICEDCTYVPAAGKDLCPAHAVGWVTHLKAKETSGPSGHVIDSYGTRAGERVYRIAWDGKKIRPLIDIDVEGELPDGARVRLVGRTLRRVT